MCRKVSAEDEDSERAMFCGFRSRFYSFLFNHLPGFADFLRRKIFKENHFGFNGCHIMNNLINLDDCSVQEIMVQRSEIRAFCLEDKELINFVRQSRHTRVPIYRDNLDNIIGFIHIKDILLKSDAVFDVKDIIHEVMYVPHSMKAISLFIKMQASRVHMAIVLDEYGSTDGLITMEDIVEQIVGDIEYEHDASSIPDIVNLSPDRMEVNARVLVKNLEQTLGITLREANDEEEYDTVGGLIFSMVGRVPVVDEVFHHKSGVVFSIKEADNRCIYKVVIDLSPATQKASSP
ncbi:hemolysin family protein [Anaplasma platys]|nr:hemolysin family protein [Anaplasma platys]